MASFAPATIADYFNRTTGSGWGSASTGQAWTSYNAGTNYVATSIEGVMSVDANASMGYNWFNFPSLGLTERSDAEVLVRMKWEGSVANPLTHTGPIINKHATDQTFYYSTLQGNYGEIAIGVYIKGTPYELARSPKGLNKNTWYWVRFKQAGSTLYLKVWDEAVVEPVSWNIVTAEWSPVTKPRGGSVGFWRRGTRDNYTVRVKDFFYYTGVDSYSGTFASDSFERVNAQGFGVSSSGHMWEANFSADPSVQVDRQQGSVVSGAGNILLNDNRARQGFLGPSITGDTEILAEFDISQATTSNTYINFGIRGNYDISGGVVRISGYFCQLQAATNTIKIGRKETFSSPSESIMVTGTLSEVLPANVKYKVRFQIRGTTLRARAWRSADAEPTTWQATATNSVLTSGRAWIRYFQSSTPWATIVNLYDYAVLNATDDSAAVKNYSNVTTYTFTANTDTSLSFSVTYTDDINNNNSLYVEYKATTDSVWLVGGVTSSVDRTQKKWFFTISNLKPNTLYETRAYIQDVDGVYGYVPLKGTVRTANNGITSAALSVSSITSTTANVLVIVSGDANSNGSATVYARASSQEESIIQDTFNGSTGTLLESHSTDDGSAWIRHSLSTVGASASIVNNRLAATTVLATDKALYYTNKTNTSNEYDVYADVYTGSVSGTVAILGRLSSSAVTCYGASYNASTGSWDLFKYVNGVYTLLASTPYVLDQGTIYNVRLILRDGYKTVEVNNQEVARSIDNTITSAGYAGYLATNIENATPTNHMLIDNFQQGYRTPTGVWVNKGTTTLAQLFSGIGLGAVSVTGLDLDTVYEFRGDITDPDGVFAGGSTYAAAMTVGNAVKLTAVGAVTQATSAVIEVIYDNDLNDNCSVSIQYRAVRETLWTTVNAQDILAVRSSKRFTTTLVNLLAATTYEVQVTVDDPNGLIEGSPRQLTGLFTTYGVRPETRKRTKHYLWKVYTPDSEYLGTIETLDDPEYTWQENGGVTDLALRLNRRISEIGSGRNPLIAQQNIVDVWVSDPSSDGLGPNLVPNEDFNPDMAGWLLGPNWSYLSSYGPDESSSLYYYNFSTTVEDETLSAPIKLASPSPVVVKAIGRAQGGNALMYVKAYNEQEVQIDSSDEIGETVGTAWQQLHVTYTPPPDAAYIRVVFRNRGKALIIMDKVELYTKEMLVYRGSIESYAPTVTQDGEYIDIQLLGLVSQLSDDYIEFLQYADVQPVKDTEAGRPNRGPADPSTMLRDIIDIMRIQNPRCHLYYTNDSIQPTGRIMKYTFRDQQLRACFDKVRGLCPPDWHYFVEPDGLVVLRGPEHVKTHVLKTSVNISTITTDFSIRNLKNYVRIKGRQDEDMSEVDGYGSISYVAFDQESIDKYGKRTAFVREAQITDPETAQLYGDGHLDELNREEMRTQCVVPDEKSLKDGDALLVGYNIEAFRPGDLVQILDPTASPRRTYWNQFVWDQDTWDISNTNVVLPQAVPIRSVQIHGIEARLELSERQPSAVSDYGKLARWLSVNRSDSD